MLIDVNVGYVYFVLYSAPLIQHLNKRRLISLSHSSCSFCSFSITCFKVSIDAGPIPTVENCSLVGNHCNDLAHCRIIWNIVWSCLVTIFSCTWVAVHPNVPCLKKREANSWIKRCIGNPLLSFAEHRLPLFICALLVPEYILAWSIRQFLRARKINKCEFELWGKFSSIAGILSKIIVRTRMVNDAWVLHLHGEGSISLSMAL